MDAKDEAQRELAKSGIEPRQKYRHYKGDYYRVVCTCIKEDTLEPMVVYRSIAKGTTWARTLANWSETVDVGGRQQLRFEPDEG